MQLTRLELLDFRSYGQVRFDFGNLTVLLGPNGIGKTNIIEAIGLLSTGMSQRAGKIEEMIAWEKEIATVSGIVDKGEAGYVSLVVVLTKGVVLGHKTPKRRYLVDGNARPRNKLVGNLPSITFRPEDMRLIEGSPSRRRQYLDETLSSMSPEYARSLSIYEASLRQRNRLLDALREGIATRAQFAYWDQSILKHGEVISRMRRLLIEHLNSLEMTFGKYEIVYDDSPISVARLKQYEHEEVAVGYTLVGPHKDDFQIFSLKKNLMIYGSRGEQRLGVLFLKMGALSYIERITGDNPLILLDDIFSELDQQHREEILALIQDHQCVITTAEPEIVELLPHEAKIIRL
ncbi:MAG: DNA replication and repair protein RecF [bacterium]